VYTNLEDTLCNACCNYYGDSFLCYHPSIIYIHLFLADEETIPQGVLQLDGALAQLAKHHKSDFASEIFQIAAGYQSQASDNRLGLPRTQNASLQKATNSRFKKAAPGISKGKTLLAEMNTKKEEAGRVKVTAGLYMVFKKKGGNTDIMKRVKISLAFKLPHCD
jgi:hypothetical protein